MQTSDGAEGRRAAKNGSAGKRRDREAARMARARLDEDRPIDQDTLDGLEADAQRYGRIGVWIFAAGLVLGAGLIVASYYLTEISVRDLKESGGHDDQMLILLLVRGTLFGALSIAYLYGVFTIATAYIDQSTRFRKRLYSAHMMNYVFARFGEQIKDKTVKMRHVVDVFIAWNENVDSAFSSVRFQRQGKDLSVGGRNLHLDVKDPVEQKRRRRER